MADTDVPTEQVLVSQGQIIMDSVDKQGDRKADAETLNKILAIKELSPETAQALYAIMKPSSERQVNTLLTELKTEIDQVKADAGRNGNMPQDETSGLAHDGPNGLTPASSPESIKIGTLLAVEALQQHKGPGEVSRDNSEPILALRQLAQMQDLTPGQAIESLALIDKGNSDMKESFLKFINGGDSSLLNAMTGSVVSEGALEINQGVGQLSSAAAHAVEADIKNNVNPTRPIVVIISSSMEHVPDGHLVSPAPAAASKPAVHTQNR
jgi:hypothetical protein